MEKKKHQITDMRFEIHGEKLFTFASIEKVEIHIR